MATGHYTPVTPDEVLEGKVRYSNREISFRGDALRSRECRVGCTSATSSSVARGLLPLRKSSSFKNQGQR